MMWLKLLLLIVVLTFVYLSPKSFIPKLVLYLLLGILASPHQLNLVHTGALNRWGPFIRNFSLAVILLRSGLGLSLSHFKHQAKPLYLLSTLPALFEALMIGLSAYLFFGFSLKPAFLLAFMLAAVSPAVIVPKMLEIMSLNDERKKDAQRILAAASLDDVLSMTLFFLLLNGTGGFSWRSLLLLPLKLIASVLLARLLSQVLLWLKFPLKFNLLLLIISAYLLQTSDVLFVLPLLSIIFMGVYVAEIWPQNKNYYEKHLSSLWSLLEIALFFYVGTIINLSLARSVLLMGFLIIIIGLMGRFIGVFIATYGLKQDKTFYYIATIPKATVQAGLASIPLAYGVAAGETLLAVAVLAILITAPLGALLLEYYDYQFRRRKSFH